MASLQKLLAHFLLKREIGEIHRKKHCTSKENDVIIHIYDQIKVTKGTVVNRALLSLHGGGGRLK